MTTLTVDASDIRQFVDRADQATVLLEREMYNAMDRSLAAVMADAMANTPTATGTLRRSYVAKPTPFVGTITNVATPYAIVIEEGRRPGAAMPPPGSMLDWMTTKGIAVGETDSVKRSIEFLIRRKIGRDGIPARRMLATALETNTPAIRREFQQALARFVGKMR